MRGPFGPFTAAASALRDLGLLVIPVNGKRPAVRGWRQWGRISQQTIEALSRQFPKANVGIITGKGSQVTIVDVDDLSLLPMALNRFGSTPLRIRSGSKKSIHLYYRFAGEGCRNLRELEGLPIDIKGEGGFVVCPPSMHPDTGELYDFLDGTWTDLDKIPPIGADNLLSRKGQHNASSNVARLRAVPIGVRNNLLFRLLLRHAPHCDDVGALRDVAFTINGYDFEEPLSSAEVEKTLKSAWRYQIEGRNWVGRIGGIFQIPSDELDLFAPFPDAFLFLGYLRRHHGGSELPFAISPKAMAEAQTVPGWTDRRRYERVRDKLVELDFLERVHIGGSRPGDPHLFRFKRRH